MPLVVIAAVALLLLLLYTVVSSILPKHRTFNSVECVRTWEHTVHKRKTVTFRHKPKKALKKNYYSDHNPVFQNSISCRGKTGKLSILHHHHHHDHRRWFVVSRKTASLRLLCNWCVIRHHFRSLPCYGLLTPRLNDALQIPFNLIRIFHNTEPNSSSLCWFSLTRSNIFPVRKVIISWTNKCSLSTSCLPPPIWTLTILSLSSFYRSLDTRCRSHLLAKNMKCNWKSPGIFYLIYRFQVIPHTQFKARQNIKPRKCMMIGRWFVVVFCVCLCGWWESVVSQTIHLTVCVLLGLWCEWERENMLLWLLSLRTLPENSSVVNDEMNELMKNREKERGNERAREWILKWHGNGFDFNKNQCFTHCVCQAMIFQLLFATTATDDDKRLRRWMNE